MANDLLERRVAEVLAMAEDGDHFLCCVDHAKDCPRYLSGACSCQIVEITADTTVEIIVKAYKANLN